MSEKRIAFVTSDLRSGGSERSASELTFALGEDFDRIFYFIFDSTKEVSYKINAELIDLKYPATTSIVKKVLNTFGRAAGIRKAVKKNGIDTVAAFTPIANRALRYSRAKCRKIASCRGFDDLMLHPGDYHKCISSGCEILFNSAEAMNYYTALYPSDKEMCYTIENLIDCDRIREKASEPLEPKIDEFYKTHKTITTVASFSRYKGHWELLKSFALLKKNVPDAGLVLVGHMGEYEETLKRTAAESEFADDIIFAGYSDNPFKFIARSDVYALSSISEGFPNALAEAMCCGTVCVSVVCRTGPRELLFNDDIDRKVDDIIIGENGIAVPAFDGVIDFDLSNYDQKHISYAKALEIALTNKELRKTLSANAVKRAEKNDKRNIRQTYLEYFGAVK